MGIETIFDRIKIYSGGTINFWRNLACSAENTLNQNVSQSVSHKKAISYYCWALTQGKCYFCGKRLDPSKSNTYDYDHIYPASKFNIFAMGNAAITCQKCNREKGDLDPFEYYNLRKYQGKELLMSPKKFIRFINEERSKYKESYKEYYEVSEELNRLSRLNDEEGLNQLYLETHAKFGTLTSSRNSNIIDLSYFSNGVELYRKLKSEKLDYKRKSDRANELKFAPTLSKFKQFIENSLYTIEELEDDIHLYMAQASFFLYEAWGDSTSYYQDQKRSLEYLISDAFNVKREEIKLVTYGMVKANKS